MIEDLFTATNVPDAVVELNLGPGLYVPLVADERRLGALVLGRVRRWRPVRPARHRLGAVFASPPRRRSSSARSAAELERVRHRR